MAAFVLDSGLQRMPCAKVDEQSICAYSILQDIAYVVAETTEVVKDDVGRADEYRGRGGLMRAVREHALDHVWRRGYSILHGSAFVVDGVATAFVGDKSAGKTTALCGALTLFPKSEFLANDRIVVGLADKGVIAYGLPTIISIRSGGARLIESLKDRLRDVSTQYDGSPFSGNDQDERRLLTTHGFSALMNCGVQRSATLKNLVFPVVDTSQQDFLLRKLSSQEIRQRISSAAFARSHLQEHTELFAMPSSGRLATEFEKSERLDLIGERINCYELRMSPGFYTRPSMARFMNLISI
ncbi:MAG: hypothetical protein ACKOBW_11085 [Planctomycetota bacterium]